MTLSSYTFGSCLNERGRRRAARRCLLRLLRPLPSLASLPPVEICAATIFEYEHMHNSPLTQAPEGKQRHDRMTTASVLLRRGAIAFPAARKRVSCALASSLPAASAASAAHLPIHARSFPLVHAPSSSPFSFQHRSVFTYPAPRKLTDIMKVPLVRKCEPVEIKVRREEGGA